MKNTERCRGIVSHEGPRKGRRCRYKAIKGGFCGFHQAYVRPRKTEAIHDSSDNYVTDRKIKVTAEANGCTLVVEGTPFQVGVIMKRVLA